MVGFSQTFECWILEVWMMLYLFYFDTHDFLMLTILRLSINLIKARQASKTS